MYSTRVRLSVLLTLAIVLGACAPAAGTAAPSEPPAAGTAAPTEPPATGPSVGIPGLESLKLPDKISGGTIIPWPEPSVRKTIGEDLRTAMLDSGFKEDVVASFDFTQAAAYPNPDALEAATVPIAASYDKADFKGGLKVGVFWDVSGKLGYGEKKAFAVTFFEDGHAELTDAEGKAFVTRELLFAEQESTFGIKSRTFFVQGSCWGCWTIDSRCGCLLCW